jgi:uncharacterized protein (TIGR03118 family)
MLAAVFAASYLASAGAANARGYIETDLVVGGPDAVQSTKTLTDKNGITHHAKSFDKNLVNPWGIAESPTSPFWISDNNAGVATIYDANGNARSLVVSIPLPTPADPLQPGGAPTGAVWNTAQAGGAFKIPGYVGPSCTLSSAPASFLFATEDATIVGWAGNVYPTQALCKAGKTSTHGIIAKDNSDNGSPNGAVYKGLAIATTEAGATFLYATNFRAGRVERYGPTFALLDTFTDPFVPAGFAPFNVVPIRMEDEDEDTLVVTFALQKPGKHDDQAGPGNGFVDTFNLAGHDRQRLVSRGHLNSPWGVALAPSNFGDLSGALLIGNFGDGQINAFEPDEGEFVGKVRNPTGQPIVIEGLWAIKFGNDATRSLSR